MGYKIKRGSVPKDNTMKGILLNVIKRFVVFILILLLTMAILSLLFWLAYREFPIFAGFVDEAWSWIKRFSNKHGWGVTLGIFLMSGGAIWVLGEEIQRKERYRDMMRGMWK